MSTSDIISVLKQELRWFKDNNRQPMPYAVQAVIDHGRPYIGISRPKGYRHQRRVKECFWNAARLAIGERGTYVEGFGTHDDDVRGPIHHAWITLDGVHAIDPTWNIPANKIAGMSYVGIAFPTEIVARHMAHYIREERSWKPLMEDDAAIRALLATKPAGSRTLQGASKARLSFLR
jgi:hypothetical protein